MDPGPWTLDPSSNPGPSQVMHQLSECLPTLPIVKKADNTLHPHTDQETDP